MDKPKLSEIPSSIRIEADGSIVIGDGCLTIRPVGQDIHIAVAETPCGHAMAEVYLPLIERTIGQGGRTIYELPVKIRPVEPVEPVEPVKVEVKPRPVETVPVKSKGGKVVSS